MRGELLSLVFPTMPPSHSRLLPAILCCLALAAPALAGRKVPTTPYALRGRAPDLESVVLAETSIGPISALDLLMFDYLAGDSLGRVPFEALLAPDSFVAEPHADKIAVAIKNMVAIHLATAETDWGADREKSRVLAVDGAFAVWIEHVVKPRVKIMQADINRAYLQHYDRYYGRRTARVRYIFRALAEPEGLPPFAAGDDAPATPTTTWEALYGPEMADTMADLREIAERIDDGEFTFEQAARRFSDAPSAAHGGLLPEFINGTFFAAFERQVFRLEQPGEISPVFAGPAGAYLVQLVERSEPFNIPVDAVAEQIREGLTGNHLREYFEEMLTERRKEYAFSDFSRKYGFLDLDVPMTRVRGHALSRRQMMFYFGDLVDPADYSVIQKFVNFHVARWANGKIVLDELRRHNLHQHRWILRAREFADTIQKLGHVLATEIPADTYDTNEHAWRLLRWVDKYAGLLQRMRLARIVVRPKDYPNLMTEAAREDVAALEEQLVKRRWPLADGIYNAEDWHRRLVADETPDYRAAIAEIGKRVRRTRFRGLEWQLEDVGWIELKPDGDEETPEWARPLHNVGIGRFGPGFVRNEEYFKYWVLDRAPLPDEPWLDDPLFLRELAFDAGRGILLWKYRSRIENENLVQLRFPVPRRD